MAGRPVMLSSGAKAHLQGLRQGGALCCRWEWVKAGQDDTLADISQNTATQQFLHQRADTSGTTA